MCKRFTLIIFMPAALMLLVSCAAERLQISLLDDISFWDQGQGYISLTDDVTEMVLCVERVFPEEVQFYTEITNLGTEPVTVEPGGFYYTYEAKTEDGDIVPAQRRIPLLDPEKQIASIDGAISRENRNYERSSVLNRIFFCMGCISGMAGVVSGDKETIKNGISISAGAVDEMVDDEISHEGRSRSLEEQREYWSRHVLGKSTLEPGGTAGGMLIFPVSREAAFLTVHCPVGPSVYQYKCRQVIVRE